MSFKSGVSATVEILKRVSPEVLEHGLVEFF